MVGNFLQAHFFVVGIDVLLRASAVPSRARAEASQGTFGGQFASELGEDREHAEGGLVGSDAGVDGGTLLVEYLQYDAALGQFVDNVDPMAQFPASRSSFSTSKASPGTALWRTWLTRA